MHNGDVYLFGGNAGLNPLGPSGNPLSQKLSTLCFNGALDPGEGMGANIVDSGGSCGLIDGCALYAGDANASQAAALARCRADGFQCSVRINAIVGANGGSDCSPANQWRFYCFASGLTDATCGPQAGQTRSTCVLGEIHSGHTVSCSCNNEPPVTGTWCQ